MRRLRLAIASAFLALGVGCVEPPETLGGQCALNSECETPLVCRLDRCRRECAATRDCPVGQLCVTDERGFGACLLPDELSCGVDSDCPASLVCRRTRCTQECVEDRDCAPGARCVDADGTRVCEDPTETTCRRNSDCGEGSICARDRRCRLPCRADRDCREGAACEAGQCVPIARPDAGAPEDAGGPDAGGLDAGTERDAGAVDASVPPPPDGGTDGGALDAGPGVPCGAASECVAPGVAIAGCEGSRCVIERCQDDRGDCDGDFENGCETPLADDPANCGGCGVSCGLMGTCTSGACDPVVELALGARHFCVLRGSGTALCMGANDQGQLGRGTTSAFEAAFGAVSGFPNPPTSLYVGPDYTCGHAIALRCFGDNDFAQLGVFDTNDRSSPTFSSAASSNDFGVALGGDVTRDASGAPSGPPTDGFACGMSDYGGNVRCWGSATIQYPGVIANPGSSFPVLLGASSDGVTDLAAGTSHVCLTQRGTVHCFGSGGPWTGQATVGGTVAPTAIATSAGATAVAAGATHACARLVDGTVECWGDNTDGQVGPGVAVGSATETAVAVPSITDAVAIASSESHTCAVDVAGQVHCWGANDRGQLGDGTTTSSATPVRAGTLDGVIELTLAWGRSCALRFDGSVWCWGSTAEDYGVVGDTTAWTTPTAHPHFPGAP
jgi:hypothetical protein